MSWPENDSFSGAYKSNKNSLLSEMKPIWKMWRMVCKLYQIQADYFDLIVRDSKDKAVLNVTLFRRTQLYIPRHLLNLRSYHRSMLVGTMEEFLDLPRERFINQDILDACVKEGFMKRGNPSKGLGDRVAMTEAGLEFRYFSFFLQYLLKKLDKLLSFILGGTLAIVFGIVFDLFHYITPKILFLLQDLDVYK